MVAFGCTGLISRRAGLGNLSSGGGVGVAKGMVIATKKEVHCNHRGGGPSILLRIYHRFAFEDINKELFNQETEEKIKLVHQIRSGIDLVVQQLNECIKEDKVNEALSDTGKKIINNIFAQRSRVMRKLDEMTQKMQEKGLTVDIKKTIVWNLVWPVDTIEPWKVTGNRDWEQVDGFCLAFVISARNAANKHTWDDWDV